MSIVTVDEDYAYKHIDAFDNTDSYINEYATLYKLYKYKHSNIIKMIDVSCKLVEKTQYIVFKFKKYTRTLADCKFTNDLDIIQILVDILSAIQLCHSIDIWHRDIKLENIMVDDNNRAILIDFSHSRYKNESTSVVQSVCYRAPEIFKSQKYNEKIDIYSIGVMLYNITSKNTLHSKILKLYGSRSAVETQFTKFYNTNYILQVAEYYQKDQKPLFYNNTYLLWIKQMLASANDRPSALEMLRTVLEFVAVNKLNIISPIWNTDATPVMCINKTTALLTKSAHTILVDICNKINPNISTAYVSNIITKINTSNYVITVIAIVMIVNVLYYDNGVTISQYYDKHCFGDFDEIYKKQINDEIIIVINKYNSLLFFKIYDERS